MSRRPDPQDSQDAQTPRSDRPERRPRPAGPPRPRRGETFESRRIRRTPTIAEAPWYNNWRLLLPIVVVIVLGIVLLGFALGRAGDRSAIPAAAPIAPAAPGVQVTAATGNQSIPVIVVTSTPATGGAPPAATP